MYYFILAFLPAEFSIVVHTANKCLFSFSEFRLSTCNRNAIERLRFMNQIRVWLKIVEVMVKSIFAGTYVRVYRAMLHTKCMRDKEMQTNNNNNFNNNSRGTVMITNKNVAYILWRQIIRATEREALQWMKCAIYVPKMDFHKVNVNNCINKMHTWDDTKYVL